MRLLVIGEAASYLRNDFEFENQYPDIDWFAMASLRNIIAHDYDAVDMELIWQVVHQDLPKLKKFIEKNFRLNGLGANLAANFNVQDLNICNRRQGKRLMMMKSLFHNPGNVQKTDLFLQKKLNPNFIGRVQNSGRTGWLV